MERNADIDITSTSIFIILFFLKVNNIARLLTFYWPGLKEWSPILSYTWLTRALKCAGHISIYEQDKSQCYKNQPTMFQIYWNLIRNGKVDEALYTGSTRVLTICVIPHCYQAQTRGLIKNDEWKSACAWEWFPVFSLCNQIPGETKYHRSYWVV